MGSTNPERPKKAWTPEKIIQLFKEIFTAILGLIIVVCTIYFAYKTFQYVGQVQMDDAKDILMLMLGIAGIVIGYYFGRVPADARSTQAQEQAIAATSWTERVSIQTRKIADDVDEVKNDLGEAVPGTRKPSDPTIADKLEKIRDELHAIGAFSMR